jgi:WhiB family transcriptional regulator, redox-sensing transcriptional regulator
VAPGFTRDLLRLLRAQRERDPDLSELRGRLVRDRIADAYLRRELAGGGRLDPAELAAEVGTSPTVARRWLAGLRAQHDSPQGLDVLGEPVSHGRPSPAQLAGLQAHFAAGGHQHAAVTGRPTDPERLAAEVEHHYWTREVRAGQRLQPRQLARELGGDQQQISRQLVELRAGPSIAAERITQLWHQQAPRGRPLRSSQLAWRLGVSDSYVRHVTSQLRTRAGQPPLADRLAATHQQLASPPPPPDRADGERDWRLDAACAQVDPELFFPQPGQAPQAAAAKQVCAACAVRGPCLEAALHGPQARDDHAGIFAGTTASDRVRLRGRESMAQGTRFLQDRAAAEAALELANRVSIDRAARELEVSKQALRRAFDQHGLPQPSCSRAAPSGPGSTRTARRPSRPGGERPRSASTRPARNWASRIGRYAPPGSATAWACPPPHRPGWSPAAGRGLPTAQPAAAAGPGTPRPGAGRLGAPGGGVRHLGRQRGGGAQQREPHPPAGHPRLGDHPPRPARPAPCQRPPRVCRAPPG